MKPPKSLIHIILALFTLFGANACSASSYAPPKLDYWPTSGWQLSTPEQQGVDSETLIEMYRAINEQTINLHSLLNTVFGTIDVEVHGVLQEQRP